MDSKQKVTFYFNTEISPMGTSQVSFSPIERIGYKIDDPESPDCVKVWFGRKTLYAPIRNLLLVEFDT